MTLAKRSQCHEYGKKAYVVEVSFFNNLRKNLLIFVPNDDIWRLANDIMDDVACT